MTRKPWNITLLRTLAKAQKSPGSVGNTGGAFAGTSSEGALRSSPGLSQGSCAREGGRE